MSWMIWAVLLVTHGALSRFAKGSYFLSPSALIADGILIAIALFTIGQLQGLHLDEVVRIGVFFVAFGTAGWQLMHSVLKRATATPPPRVGRA